MVQWGATLEEWQHFDQCLKLTEDLLPVVSNLDAELSPFSKMRDKGKTPSTYNKSNKVIGFTDWTSYKAESKDIKTWQGNPDYGICLQTRNIRAFDVDVDDKELAGVINNFINALGYNLPKRMRANSGKHLFAFRVDGVLAKRVLNVDGGIIEFLAEGQQFIAAGTHKSGVRYEWEGGLPGLIPTLSLEQFEDLWALLVKQFGVGDYTEGSIRNKKTELDKPARDEVIDYLEENNLVLGVGREGQRFISCPFKSSHTTDSGMSSTAYLPAGIRGYSEGRFDCRHGHCHGKTNSEFRNALGITISDFDVVTVDSSADHDQSGTGVVGLASPLARPPYLRNKFGVIKACLVNVQKALSRADECEKHIRFDTFRGNVVVAPHDRPDQWEPVQDTDYFGMRLTLERKGFETISKEVIRDGIYYVANQNRVDTAIEWLNGLVWDGVTRVECFTWNYLKTANTEYAKAVGLYTWTALAGRCLVPGIKADMVPIWEGAQGVGKSYAASQMVPDPIFFTELGFHEKEGDLSRKIKGVLLAEISELRGLHTRDLETIKAFVSRTHEEWVPKYIENIVEYPRRLLFIGTTNQTDLLADETGNRRWLPIHVGETGQIDVDGIRRDRDQLWAEARELFKEHGIMWKEVTKLAAPEHEKYMASDAWEDQILKHLDTVEAGPNDTKIRTGDAEFLATADIFKLALDIDPKNRDTFKAKRVARIMIKLGWKAAKLESGIRGYRKK